MVIDAGGLLVLVLIVVNAGNNGNLAGQSVTRACTVTNRWGRHKVGASADRRNTLVLALRGG